MNVSCHWVLGVIVWSSLSLNLFDSLGDQNYGELFLILFEPVNYSCATANLEFNHSAWEFKLASDSMKQSNNFDCGVFVCFHDTSLILKQEFLTNHQLQLVNGLSGFCLVD